MGLIERTRQRIAKRPSAYERAWLGSINAVGLVVLIGALLNVDLLLGRGQTGVFRRALYPLLPPALTLGVALGSGQRREAAVSTGVLVVYILLVVAVGTVGRALATAPVYPVAGTVIVAAATLAGWLYARP